MLRVALRFGFVSLICAIGFVSQARDRWTELNIGPFYVDTDGDSGAAREALTQLEQLRWVLGGLLESKDLPSVWPIRILLTNSEKTNPNEFVWQNGLFLLITHPGARLPLDQVAGILLDANTPRLPPDVESGLRQLFGTLEAHGSRVAWGGPPPHPDLAWARMQLLATKFEYGSSFHVFLTALRGSSIRVAEQNAFSKNPDALEREAAANLASGNWQPVSVSGRPLDPKHDFGEHSLDGTVAAVYLADAQLVQDPKSTEAAYKSAIAAGGVAAALGYEGLAHIAELNKDNPEPLFQDAIHAGSRSAPVYTAAAEGLSPAQAFPLLKKAAQLNPLWAEPVFHQAQLTEDPAEKQALLKKATQLAPRGTQYWLELAQVETANGQATAAQGTWLRAEDSAPTPAERNRIHQLRLDSEQERLNAADEAHRRDREAVHLADEHAQLSETDRIRAAEVKANEALDAAAGGSKPENAVPWDQVVPQKKLEGTLIRVDCLDSHARLWVSDKRGNIVQLFLKDSSPLGLTCGAQQPARRVSIAYAAQPDDRFHTSGNVVSIRIQ